MIYCIAFEAVEHHLVRLGFERRQTTAETAIYVREGRLFTIRLPNVFGDLPEMIVDQAFAAAGLEMPDFATHWCD